jgi:Dolichyl-phosphate-mannose-protein mannosyltransferase
MSQAPAPPRPRDEAPVSETPVPGVRRPTGRPRTRTALVVLVLVGAVVLGASLRVDSMRHKHGLHIDEVWSYITAAGGLSRSGAADTAALHGTWVPAARWRSTLGPGPVFDFGQIDSGLAARDVHPPLYYSLLHVWTLIVGVKFWTGPSLNLIIDVLTGAALFGLARRLLRDPLAGALVVLIWSVSPAVRLTSSMARMYSLEALFGVLFVWLLVGIADRGRPPSRPLLGTCLLGLATAGGVLTQYEFLLVVVGGIAYVLVMLVRVDRRRCVRALLSMAAGLVLVAVAEPGVVGQFHRESARRALLAFSPMALREKVDGAVRTVFGFFGLDLRPLRGPADLRLRLWDQLSGHQLSILVMLAFGACVVTAVALALPWSRRWLARRDWTGGLSLVFLAWIAGTIIALNLAFLSQPAVLSARYLAVAWPFFAFVPVVLSRALLPRWPYAIAAVFCLAFLVPTTLAPVNVAASSGPLPKLSGAHRVVIDCPGSGVVALAALWLPHNALVYVADPAHLQARPAAWLDPLRSGDFFVHGTDVAPVGPRVLRTRFATSVVPPSFLFAAHTRIVVYRVGSAVLRP